MGHSIHRLPTTSRFTRFTVSKTIKVRSYDHPHPHLSAKWFSLDFACVLALLNGRSTEIYEDLFLVLSQHADRLNLEFRPAQITSDFEAALIKAVADEASSFSFLCNSFVSFSFSFRMHAIQAVPFTSHRRSTDRFRPSVYQRFIVTTWMRDRTHAHLWLFHSSLAIRLRTPLQ